MAHFFDSLFLRVSVDQFSQNRYIPIRDPKGGGGIKGLSLTQDKNGETDKIVCI